MSGSKTAVVTGAGGFIGSALVRRLVEEGYRVRSVVLEGAPETFLEGVDTEIFYGDITDPVTLKPAFKGADAAFHLAALARDWGPSWLFRRLNYEGVLNVLDVAERAGVGRLLHVSTLAVHAYKPTFGGDETVPRDSTLNAYCTYKRFGEEAVRERMEAGRIPVTIVRPGIFPFGPRDTTSFYPMARALEKGLFRYVNGGRSRISVAYVENLADGIVAAARHPDAVGETFVICDDEPRSWREITEAFCNEMGIKPPGMSVPSKALYPAAALLMGLWTIFPLPGEPPLTFYRIKVAGTELFFTNRKARETLGWEPKVSFEEAVRRTVGWYRGVKGKLTR